MSGTLHCVPCRRGTAPMTREAALARAAERPDWTVAEDGRSLSRRWRLADFDTAFAFVGAVAAIARAEDHHPDVAFGWGYAAFTLTTHAIGGLHENDFTMAALIDGVAPA